MNKPVALVDCTESEDDGDCDDEPRVMMSKNQNDLAYVCPSLGRKMCGWPRERLEANILASKSLVVEG